MLQFDISKLNEEFHAGLKELAHFYGFSFGNAGFALRAEKCPNGFSASSDGRECVICYSSKALFFRAFSYCLQYGEKAFSVKKNTVKRLGIMRDSARNAVLSVDGLKELARYCAMMGYTYIEIYAEDLLDIEKYPYVGLHRGRYTRQEIREMDGYCRIFGIELVPCIQTLAHLPHLFRHDYFDEICDIADILLIGHEKTYDLIREFIKFVAQSFSSRKINIGMDEAHLLGKGKFAELQGEACEYAAELFIRHLKKVVKICQEEGFAPSLWSDMVIKLAYGGTSLKEYDGIDRTRLKEDVQKIFPQEAQLIFWNYDIKDRDFYERAFAAHFDLTKNVAFAGGAWSWCGFAPLNTLAEKSLEPAIQSALELGIEDFMVTSWGNGGGECHCMLSASTYLYVAEKLSDGGDLDDLNARAFTIFGNTYEQLKDVEIVDRTHENAVLENALKGGCNASKYLLYNDPLLGVMDAHVPKECKAVYKANSERLEEILRCNGKLKEYIEPLYTLSRCLEIKGTLGRELTKAYKENNLELLKKLTQADLTECIKRMEEFFSCYRSAYIKCNKSYGSEIVDIRFGGMKHRLRRVYEILNDYLDGKIDKIEEFEIDRMPPRSFDKAGEDILYNSFRQCLTGCNL